MTVFCGAVLGLGGMGLRQLEALRRASVSAVAVCDRDPARFADAAGHAAGLRTYTDAFQLIDAERGRLQVLAIATNGPSHHAITLAAARSGIPYILCEKPMSTSGGKAREMAAACASAGSRLAVNMTRRFSERFRRLRVFLRNGAIGRLVHVNVSVGAGGLGCIGTHYFDLVAWLAGDRPVSVSARLDDSVVPNVRGAEFMDPGGRGFVVYAGGLTASFQFSGDAPSMPLLQVYGSEGYLDLTGWASPGGRIEAYARPVARRAEPKTRSIPPERVPFDPGPPLDVVEGTAACLRDLLGEHVEDTAAGGIEAVDTVMAFHLSSARGGTPVALPLDARDLAFDVPIT